MIKSLNRLFIIILMILSVNRCNHNDGAYLLDIGLTQPDTLLIDQTSAIEIILIPTNAVCGLPIEQPIWTSSDTTIVSVDSIGNATAKAVGNAYIKVVWGDFEQTVKISVNQKFQFANDAFKNYCLEHFDLNGDGILQGLEVTDVVGLDLTDLSIEYEPISLKGIEAFDDLQKLKISHLRISDVDLSKNKQLRDIDCSLSEITTLDISHNDKLEVIDCHGCPQLSQLIIGSRKKFKSNKLNTINCYRCSLEQLDLSRCEELEYIDCRENNLSSLDLSNNNLITQISCSGNSISDIIFPQDFDFAQLKTFDK